MHFKHFYLTESYITNKFIHMSKDPVKELQSAQNQSHMKPQGVWAGIGRSWINWVESEMPEWMGEYFYTFNITDIENWYKGKLRYGNTVIRLTPEMIPDFSFYYSKIFTTGRGESELSLRMIYKNAVEQGGRLLPYTEVNWQKVSDACGGVLFSPYNKGKVSYDHSWYHGIDVPSVCIFKKEAIRGWKKVPSKLFLDSPPG